MQIIRFFLLFSCLFVLGVHAARAIPVSTDQPPASLQFTVLSSSNLSPSGDHTVQKDYSTYATTPVCILDAARVTHTFVLQNKSGRSLVIEKIMPDHFASVTITEDAQRHEFVQNMFRTSVYSPEHTFSFTVAAGQTIHIETVLETSYRQVGPYQEQLTVFVHGQSDPAAKLTVSGAFLPAAKLSPAVIDFGLVHSGTAASRIVTVALDSRLLAPPHRLEVVANSPFITVDPVEEEASASGALNSTSISDGSKPKIVQREFKLTLSANASLGPFSCDASFSSNLPMASYLMHYGDSVTVKGVVTGEASAKPDHIDFGVIPVGKTAQRKVTIVLNSPLATPQIQLDCGMGNELLATIADDKGKLLATSDSSPQPVLSAKSLLSVTHLDLTVSFTPEKPAMGIFRQVFVTLGTQQIIIPISATAR